MHALNIICRWQCTIVHCTDQISLQPQIDRTLILLKPDLLTMLVFFYKQSQHRAGRHVHIFQCVFRMISCEEAMRACSRKVGGPTLEPVLAWNTARSYCAPSIIAGMSIYDLYTIDLKKKQRTMPACMQSSRSKHAIACIVSKIDNSIDIHRITLNSFYLDAFVRITICKYYPAWYSDHQRVSHAFMYHIGYITICVREHVKGNWGTYKVNIDVKYTIDWICIVFAIILLIINSIIMYTLHISKQASKYFIIMTHG